jgi:predicted nicotinamide N-methyase
MIENIKFHNSQFFNAADRATWEKREVLTIKDVRVPQYIYKGQVDPLDHNTAVSEYIIQRKDEYEGKKILDIGTCAGINNILLTKEGFEVIGLDNSIYSLNGAIYVMDLNNVYYRLIKGDQDDIKNIDYDILIINQMDYLPEFMRAIGPIIKSERERGKFVIMTRTKR